MCIRDSDRTVRIRAAASDADKFVLQRVRIQYLRTSGFANNANQQKLLDQRLRLLWADAGCVCFWDPDIVHPQHPFQLPRSSNSNRRPNRIRSFHGTTRRSNCRRRAIANES